MSLNGSTVRRRESTIFIKLPRAAWRLIEGGCSCSFCKAVPGRLSYWDTLAVGKDKPSEGNDHAWTVHQPENHPEGLHERELDREGSQARRAA